MGSWLTGTCCLAVLLAGVVGGFTGASLAGEAKHLPLGAERLQFRGLLTAPAGTPRPVNPQATSNLILEEDESLASFDLDRSLTKRCRAGRFRQQREHLYIVRLNGFVYGAVIGGRRGLYDPDHLAVQDLVYALRWENTGRCEVYVLRHLSG